MKVISKARFKIKVYPNDHPPPHCHVIYKDGSDVSVDIPLISPRYGATIPREVEEAIAKDLEKLCAMWDKLNTKRELTDKPKKEKK